MRLSVISPTLNEAENVPRLVKELERALGEIDYEILIVDDNSPDRTWSVAQDISLTNPRVRSVRRMQDPGLSVAVIEGFSAAEGDVVACIDADLQHDPAILARMLDELQQGRMSSWEAAMLTAAARENGTGCAGSSPGSPQRRLNYFWESD